MRKKKSVEDWIRGPIVRQIFHNTLVLLSRIEAEATGMQKKEVEP